MKEQGQFSPILLAIKSARSWLLLLLFLWAVSGCQIPGSAATGVSTTAPGSPNPMATTPSLPSTIAMTPTLSATMSPTPPPTEASRGYLAVLATKDLQPGDPEHPQLYLIEVGGNIMIAPAENALEVRDVAWSPDGQKLAFTTLPVGQYDYDIFVVSADGTNSTRLQPPITGGADEGSPSWSPDGNSIAFTQSDAGDFLIHIMSADGTESRFLTKGLAPSWSPDGQSIVFVRPHPDVGFGDIYVVGVDGLGLRQITDDIRARDPAWSPDGGKIAFSGYDLSGENEGIYVMNADGSNRLRVSDVLLPPSWALDSTQVLVPRMNIVYLVQADASGRTWIDGLPPDLNYLYAAWQPRSNP